MLRVLVSLIALGLGLACQTAGDTVPLHVYAAASLTDAFVDLERAFERRHPGTDVTLTFAGSQVLRLQIEHGAAADVFASANLEHMRALQDAGRVLPHQIFAHNELVVIVPPDNPAKVHALPDLAQTRRLVVGAGNVPVGAYAREMLTRADAQRPGFADEVLSRVVSEESNVRQIRAKVELGEADAAIVYRTDATSSNRVHTVEIPAEVNTRAAYPIAVVKGSSHDQQARQWIAFLGSPTGVEILHKHGFRSP